MSSPASCGIKQWDRPDKRLLKSTADSSAAEATASSSSLILALAGHEVEGINVGNLRKERRRSDADVSPVG